MSELTEFCFYKCPDEGPAYGDTGMVRAAGGVGRIAHLGFGDFAWTDRVDGVEVGVVFSRFVDRANECDTLPSTWQSEWHGRVHTLSGDVDALMARLVSPWGAHPIEVHSIEGGRGVIAKRRAVA